MRFLIVLSLLVTALNGYAGTDGHGGDGVILSGGLYSLDLVEAGVERNPYFDLTLTLDSKIKERLAKKLDQQIFPVDLLASKLTEIKKVDALFSLYILKAIELYQWRLVDSSLIDIKDEESLLKYPAGRLVQLASRSSGSVLIDKNLWKKLDSANKTALIFHEALYAMVRPYYLRDLQTGDHIKNIYGEYMSVQAQSSPRAREVNGYLFTKDLSNYGKDGLHQLFSTKYDFEWGNGGTITVAEKYGDSLLTMNPSFYLYSTRTVVPEPVLLDGMDSSLEQIQAYAKVHCELVASEMIPMVMKSNERTIRFRLANYKGLTGERTYIEIDEDFVVHSDEPVNYVDEKSCIERATLIVSRHANYLKYVYKNAK